MTYDELYMGHHCGQYLHVQINKKQKLTTQIQDSTLVKLNYHFNNFNFLFFMLCLCSNSMIFRIL